jgi:hypothetical protein
VFYIRLQVIYIYINYTEGIHLRTYFSRVTQNERVFKCRSWANVNGRFRVRLVYPPDESDWCSLGLYNVDPIAGQTVVGTDLTVVYDWFLGDKSFVSVYRLYSASDDNILMWIIWSVVYTGDGLQFIISACYSWEMTLNVGLHLSLNNMQDGKATRMKAREVNSIKARITNDEISLWILNECYTSLSCTEDNI